MNSFLTLIRRGDEYHDPQVEPNQDAVDFRAKGVLTATDGAASVVSIPLSAIIMAAEDVKVKA